MTTTPHHVGVVIGSTRTTRICPDVAQWVLANLRGTSTLTYEIVDLAEINLPFLDEPLMPALGNYQHEHTRAWSARVARCDAFVFVFPQYNWGYPAPLKNALDFLYAEWHDKPAATVTYGTRGGAQAASQVRQVLHGLHMRPWEEGVALVITHDDVDDAWQLTDPATTFAPFVDRVRAMDRYLTDLLEDGQTETLAAGEG